MTLRAKKPEAIQKRLKLFMFGEAGVGKTTAAIQFPDAYLIDAERGMENYDKTIATSESVVFPTTDIDEVITEVRSLLTEKHDYRTIVIDPITPLYTDLLEKCEKITGTEWGRHYGEANKSMKRLINLLMMLDMNVIMTSHAKAEYGDEMKKIGITFDGWKKLDYVFDLVLQLDRRGPKRFATVRKTRLEAFPDGDSFEWDYKEFIKRVGDTIEQKAEAVALATAQQVTEINGLLEVVTMPDGTTGKWFTKANVDRFEDMTGKQIEGCIKLLKSKVKKLETAAA